MTDETCLHFLCGKAGAGKSTHASALAERHQAILVCEDVWLARLFGDQMNTFEDYKVFARRLKTVVGPLVVNLLAAKRSVVLDFPANTRAARVWFRSLFEAAGVAHTLHYLDVPDQTCLQRIGWRNIERPEGSHHLTDEEFARISSYFEAPQTEEGFRLVVHRTASTDQ